MSVKKLKSLAQKQAEMRARHQAMFDALTPQAIQVVELRLKDKKDKYIAFEAAKFVLDRSGFSPKTIHELTGKNGAPIKQALTIRFVGADGKPTNPAT